MSFLGGLIGGIAGFITGGPAGAVIGAAGGFGVGGSQGGVAAGLGAAGGYAQRTMPGGGGLSSSPLGNMPVLSYPTTRAPQVTGATLPFAGSSTSGFAVSPPAQQTGVMTAGATSDAPTGAALAACDIKGHHLNRSTYYTHSFGLFHKHEKGSTCVKNRRMNVGNARALRRALTRARGFEKLAMKTIRILHPGKKGRFGGFKTRRRSR